MLKKHAIFSLLIFLSINLIADDWDLLQPHIEAFYCVERNASSMISRYEVDTVKVNNDGSRTYYINYHYRSELFATCPEWSGNIFYGEPGGLDFLSVDSLHIDQGINTITYGDDILRINQFAEVGETIVSGFFEISCFQKELVSFLGTTDSIKFFSLSYSTFQDTIILSKNHGLIESPYFFDMLSPMPEVSRILLAGTEVNGSFAGNRTFDALEFLPYQIGDTIEMIFYENGNTGYPTSETNYVSTYITNSILSQDELILYYSQDITSIFVDNYNNITDTTIHPLTNDTIIYDLQELQYGLDYEIHYYIQGRPHFSFIDNADNYTDNFLVKIDQNYDFDLQKEKLTYTFYGTNIFTDFCDIVTLSDTYQQYELTHCYGETERINQNFVWYNSYLELTKPPSMSSTCSDDLSYCDQASWEITVPNNIASSISFGIDIYPNPTEDFLFISYGDLEIYNIELIDLAGKRVHNYMHIGKSLDVSFLESGIYYVLIKSSKGKSLEKFTKI